MPLGLNLVFSIDAQGNVSTTDTDTLEASGNTVTFKNVTISVDPTDFAGQWFIDNVNTPASGTANVVVVPGVPLIFIADGAGSIFFVVTDTCAVNPSKFVLGGSIFTLTCQASVPILSCIGFQSPMDNGPVTVKKNRVLPFKSIVEDENASPITDSDIVSPPVIQVLFDSGIAPAIDVTDDALPAGEGTEGNQFEFSTDKWQFNLKTKNYTALGTYTVTMQSGDDAEYAIAPTCTGIFVIE